MTPPKSSQPAIREHIATVISNEVVNKQYKQLCLSVPPLALQVEPGQFFHLLCPQVDELSPFFRRPMSIYRIDRQRSRLHFLYKVTGVGTAAMARLQPGNPFNIFGPLASAVGRDYCVAGEFDGIANDLGTAIRQPCTAIVLHVTGREINNTLER